MATIPPRRRRVPAASRRKAPAVMAAMNRATASPCALTHQERLQAAPVGAKVAALAMVPPAQAAPPAMALKAQFSKAPFSKTTRAKATTPIVRRKRPRQPNRRKVVMAKAPAMASPQATAAKGLIRKVTVNSRARDKVTVKDRANDPARVTDNPIARHPTMPGTAAQTTTPIVALAHALMTAPTKRIRPTRSWVPDTSSSGP